MQLVTELVSSHRMIQFSNAETSANFTSDMHLAIDSQSADLQASVGRMQVEISDYATNQKSVLDKASGRLRSDYEVFESDVSKAKATATQAHQLLDAMIANINSDVESLSAEVDRVNAENVEAVHSTKVTVSRILSDVQSASSAMSSGVSHSLDAFVSSMDSHGENAKTHAKEFFEEIGSGLASQNAVLIPWEERSIAFERSTMESRLKPRGTTPEKAPFRAFPNLSSTRDHNLIKSEAKAKLQTTDRAPLAELSANLTASASQFADKDSSSKLPLDTENVNLSEGSVGSADGSLPVPSKKAARPRSSSRLRPPSSRALGAT